MESDLVKGAEHVVDELLPKDRPSDTRQVSALQRAAEDAAHVAEGAAPVAEAVVGALDPGLEPIFAEVELAIHGVVDSVATVLDKLDGAKHAVAAKVAEALATPPPLEVAAPTDTVATSGSVTEPQPTNADGTPIPTPDAAPTGDVGDPAAADPTNGGSPADSSTVPAPDAAAAAPADPALDTALADFAALSPSEQGAFLAKLSAASQPPG